MCTPTNESGYPPIYRPLGKILVERAIIERDQLAEALGKQETVFRLRRLGEILLRLRYITTTHLAEALSEQLGVPIERLENGIVPEAGRDLMDVAVARWFRVVPPWVCRRGRSSWP